MRWCHVSDNKQLTGFCCLASFSQGSISLSLSRTLGDFLSHSLFPLIKPTRRIYYVILRNDISTPHIHTLSACGAFITCIYIYIYILCRAPRYTTNSARAPPPPMQLLRATRLIIRERVYLFTSFSFSFCDRINFLLLIFFRVPFALYVYIICAARRFPRSKKKKKDNSSTWDFVSPTSHAGGLTKRNICSSPLFYIIYLSGLVDLPLPAPGFFSSTARCHKTKLILAIDQTPRRVESFKIFQSHFA